MKKIFSILALALVTMTASAVEAPSYSITKKKSDVTIKVNGEEATTAKENDVVTVVVTPPEGKYPATVVCRPYTSWSGAKTRGTSLAMSGNFLATKVTDQDNTYTFKMPAKNVEVSATYAESMDATTQETDNGEKEVSDVTFGIKPTDEAPYIDDKTGQTVVSVAVTKLNVPVQTDASATDKKDLTVVVQSETTSADGETVYVVTTINKEAFVTDEGSNAQVVAVVLPETKNPINIEDGAMKPEGRVLKVIAPLQMLDDYANMTSLKDNVQQGKVSATAKPKNKYWTFSSGIDVLLPQGVKAYKVMWADATIQIEELSADELKLDGDYSGIKSNNGVLLSCEIGKGGDEYEVFASPAAKITGAKPATADAKTYKNNSLVPTIESYNYPAADYLILFDNEFHTIVSNLSEVPPCKAVLKRVTAEK